METFPIRPGGKVLVFAPHPDDESLACGGLIQRALARGAVVDVVIATDGDANPWPQRVAERRWRLDADAPRRWGRRRVGEALGALARLGVDASHVEFLHWPDQGITELLMTQANPGVERLAGIIARHGPDLVLVPAIHDSHPDHNALGLLLDAAMRRQSGARQVLAYQVHGNTPAQGRPPGGLQLLLSPKEYLGKRDAVLLHASQAIFGNGRLLQYVGGIERYQPACIPVLRAQAQWRWHFSASCPWAARAARTLQVVAIDAGGGMRAVRLDLATANACGNLRIARRGRNLEIEAKPWWPGVLAMVAKPDTGHRRVIYDAFGWNCSDMRMHVPEPDLVEGEAQVELASGT